MSLWEFAFFTLAGALFGSLIGVSLVFGAIRLFTGRWWL